jgi:glycosyltransferase involved in cell wall biosynthesis
MPEPTNGIMAAFSWSVDSLGSRPLSWNNRLGTILGTAGIINKMKTDLATLAEHCDAMVTIAKWYETILKKNGVPANKLHYIAQGLPMPLPPKSVSTGAKVQYPIRLLFIGRIDPKKGLHLLIEAFEKLDSRMVTLSIYGPTSDKSYEQDLKRRTENMQNIFWKGFAPQDQVVSVMRSHDLLCLCSTFSEMSPLVIQEAFAAGIPVLASNVYGNSEEVKPGVNGWLFHFKDSQDLLKKLQMLIENPALIDEAKQNITAVRQFRAVAKEYEHLYTRKLVPA